MCRYILVSLVALCVFALVEIFLGRPVAIRERDFDTELPNEDEVPFRLCKLYAVLTSSVERGTSRFETAWCFR
jgi:hypothetical protein